MNSDDGRELIACLDSSRKSNSDTLQRFRMKD